jgi:hypothetical protein
MRLITIVNSINYHVHQLSPLALVHFQRAVAGERFCPLIFVPQQPELPHAA